MMQNAYNELERGAWADPDPTLCPCSEGWLLSNFDTFHRCPYHGENVPHPNEFDADLDEDTLLALVREARTAYHQNLQDCYVEAAKTARRNGFEGTLRHFNAKVAQMSASTKPADMLHAAWDLAHDVRAQAEEENAHAAGFTCALEARLDDEAAWERKEMGGGYLGRY